MKQSRIRQLVLSVGLMLGLGMFASNAHASTLTLSDAQLALAQGVGLNLWAPTNNVGGDTTQIHLTGSNEFTTFFEPAPFPGATASWTLDLGSNIAAVAGDVFALDFLNSNANTWDFQLTVVTVGGGSASSAWTPLAVNQRGRLTTAGLGVGTTAIDKVIISVSGDIPLFDDDYTANFTTYAAPEPTSLLLLGAGLVSLAGVRWRKNRA